MERLIANYRGATPTDTPILRDRADAAAYAAYRMPATFEAVHAALEAFAEATPACRPRGAHRRRRRHRRRHLAVATTWPGDRAVTVLDWAEPALALGREIAAAHPALRGRTLGAGPDRQRPHPARHGTWSPSRTSSTSSRRPTAPPSWTPRRQRPRRW
ncbi:hypothetical protein SHIRM173S_06586 [Streptomyces hirsutus]